MKKFVGIAMAALMALYMAASVKEMPHMMLNSVEYWKQWLEAEVDENGDELSKK